MEINEFLTTPVIWFLIGLVLLLLELAIPGLIIIFFGIGAWITAIFTKIFDVGINLQLFIFLVSSILSLALLRKYFRNNFFGGDSNKDETFEDEFIGKPVTAETDLKAGVKGKISFKGSTWSAISDVDIEAGEEVKITEKDSITLHVTRK